MALFRGKQGFSDKNKDRKTKNISQKKQTKNKEWYRAK